jgi:hypothetical protein
MQNLIFWALLLTAAPIFHSRASVGSATGCYKLSVNIPTQLDGSNSGLLPTGASICTSEKKMQDAGYNRALQTGEIKIVIRNLKGKIVAAYELGASWREGAGAADYTTYGKTVEDVTGSTDIDDSRPIVTFRMRIDYIKRGEVAGHVKLPSNTNLTLIKK